MKYSTSVQKHGEEKVRNKKKLMRRENEQDEIDQVLKEPRILGLWLLAKPWEEAGKTSNEGKSGGKDVLHKHS